MLVDINHTCLHHFPYSPSLHGNLNRLRMAMLACALRFSWDKNT